MIPMMIKGGYRAVAVAFDVWGLAGLVNDGLKKAKTFVDAEEEEKAESAATPEADKN